MNQQDTPKLRLNREMKRINTEFITNVLKLYEDIHGWDVLQDAIDRFLNEREDSKIYRLELLMDESDLCACGNEKMDESDFCKDCV